MPSIHDIAITLTARADRFNAGLNQASTATKTLEKSVGQLQGQLAKTTSITNSATSGMHSLTTGTSSLLATVSKLTLGYLSAHTIIQGVNATFAAGASVERQDRAWRGIAGSVEAGRHELDFVRASANRLGVVFLDLEHGYRKIAASAKDTNLEGATSRQVFLDLVTAMQALGTSSPDIANALRAVSQMMNTGVVQADELRNELGNVLPNAVGLAAKSMNMLTQDFRKLQESGGVITGDFLPSFARLVRDTYAPALTDASAATHTLEQQTNVLENTLRDLAAMTFKASGVESWAKDAIQWLNVFLKASLDAENRLKSLHEQQRQQASETIQTERGSVPLPAAAAKKAEVELLALEKTMTETYGRLRDLERQQERFAAMGSATRLLLEPQSLTLQIETERQAFEKIKAQREAFLKTVAQQERAGYTLPVTRDSTGHAQEMLEHSRRLTSFDAEVVRVQKSVSELAETLKALQTSPFEIHAEQAKLLDKELERLRTKYKDLMQPMPGRPQASGAPLSRAPLEQQQAFQKYGTQHRVDPLLLEALAAQESNFNPRAVSKAGAQGLMQIMPGTQKRFGVTDPFNIAQSAEAAAKYIAFLQGKFQQLTLALAGYNAGEGAVQQAKGIPPLLETQAFVPAVMAKYHALQGATTAPPGIARIEPLIALRDELEAGKAAQGVSEARRVAIDKETDAIARLVAQMDTLTTAEDRAARNATLQRLATAAAIGDIEAMATLEKTLEEQLRVGTVAMSARERAVVLTKLSSMGLYTETAGLATQALATAKAFDTEAASLEQGAKAVDQWQAKRKKIEDDQEDIARLVKQMDTMTTPDDRAARDANLAKLSDLAGTGDTTAMLRVQEELAQQLTLGNISLSARERALALATLATQQMEPALRTVATAALETARAFDQEASSIEEGAKQLEQWQAVSKELIHVEELLARVEEDRGETIANLVQQLRDGLPLLTGYQRLLGEQPRADHALQQLRELGAGAGSMALAETYASRTSAEFQAMQEGAANLAASIEETLIASLTKGGDAWKQFGDIAIQELLRIMLNATQFRQTLEGLLTQAGEALLKIFGGGGATAGGGSGDIDFSQHGGWSTARSLMTGEGGVELMHTARGTQLVGAGGPELVHPRGPAFVLPHRETMTMLRQRLRSAALSDGMANQRLVTGASLHPRLLPRGLRLVGMDGPEAIRAQGPTRIMPHAQTMALLRSMSRDDSAIQQMARREVGGSLFAGEAALVGEGGVEAAFTTGTARRRGGLNVSGSATVTIHVHGAKDARSFLQSASEIKRTFANMGRSAQGSL